MIVTGKTADDLRKDMKLFLLSHHHLGYGNLLMYGS